MRKLSLKELGRISVEEFKKIEKLPIAIVIDNIRSALNVGSAFRTADAFAVEKIYLLGISAQPPHREILKTAIGATDSVDWEYHKDDISLKKALERDKFKLIAIEQAEKSTLLSDFMPKKAERYALVFGNEVSGVSQSLMDIADDCLEIPQFGTKHSLNISVSVGIVIWDLFNKLGSRS